MFQCNCLYNAMFQYNCLYYLSGIERFRGYKRIYRSQMCLYYPSYLVANAMFQYNCIHYPSGIERFRGYKRIYRSQMFPFSRLVRHAGKNGGLILFLPPAHGGPIKTFISRKSSPRLSYILNFLFL